MTVPKALQTLETIRAHSDIPVILMTYFNPTHRYGLEQFAKDAAAAGADGTIQTDLTPEEAQEWIEISRRTGLDTVFLLAPTSTPERIARVCAISTGFVYCVSRTGVTGAREDVPVELPSLLASVREQTETPALVGFGISRPEHVRRIGAFADGVVVGSALVDVIAEASTSPDLADRVFRFAADLKQATREPQH
jgi:tryptophan synthase alpha chain